MQCFTQICLCFTAGDVEQFSDEEYGRRGRGGAGAERAGAGVGVGGRGRRGFSR